VQLFFVLAVLADAEVVQGMLRRVPEGIRYGRHLSVAGARLEERLGAAAHGRLQGAALAGRRSQAGVGRGARARSPDVADAGSNTF
jgi:hypothetical protein